VREEIDALMREKELHVKNIERELETLRAAAAIMNEGGAGGHAQPQAMAAAAPIPTAPVESFPVQSATPAPEPARKRWP
jgi:hypothetical protein